jgi:hypothetical protein
MGTRNLGLGERLRPRNRVAEGEISLTPAHSTRGSVRATVDKEALRHAGRDPEDPGTASWFYLRNEGLLVLDLGGEYTDDGDGGDGT